MMETDRPDWRGWRDISKSCHLPSGHRFETMCRQQQARPAGARALKEELPWRWCRPTVSRALARRFSKPPARRTRKPVPWRLAASTPTSRAMTSHGVIAIPTYIDRIKVGHIVPGAKWTIVQESPTTTVIDGHWGFGFHVNAKAMALTIEKAKTANVAACTVFRQSHVGRLAAYPMMAMREGMIGLATADSGRSPKAVAPYGGREARLGTNPISIAVPSDLDAPFYLDMATSAVAAGKISACRRARRENSHRLDRRQRRPSNHRPPAIPQRRRAAAARRYRRLQGQRPGCHGRGTVRAAHRPGFRGRADRPA